MMRFTRLSPVTLACLSMCGFRLTALLYAVVSARCPVLFHLHACFQSLALLYAALSVWRVSLFVLSWRRARKTPPARSQASLLQLPVHPALEGFHLAFRLQPALLGPFQVARLVRQLSGIVILTGTVGVAERLLRLGAGCRRCGGGRRSRGGSGGGAAAAAVFAALGAFATLGAAALGAVALGTSALGPSGGVAAAFSPAIAAAPSAASAARAAPTTGPQAQRSEPHRWQHISRVRPI